MSLANYFPIYSKLTKSEQDMLTKVAVMHTAEKDTILHTGAGNCMGLLVVKSGQLK